MEHPPDRAGFGQVAAVLAHQVAEFTDDTIAVRGNNLNQHAHASRAVAFKGRFLILFALELPSAAKNGALDVFTGHVGGLRGQNRGS